MMKTCPMCGTDAAIDKSYCDCGYRFVSVGTNETIVSRHEVIRLARPNGTVPMIIGWACLVVSALLVFASFSYQPESWEIGPYASPTVIASGVEKLAKAWFLQVAGGGFFSLFLVLWSVGYIVRAISYLPAGKDITSD